jgi:hypothetical protein
MAADTSSGASLIVQVDNMNDSNTPSASKALLVAGMHRSGTSAVTRILSLLGAELPDNLMAAHSQFNPTGFWESNDVVAINDRLLSSAGAHWDTPQAIDIGALSSTAVRQFQAEVGRLLEAGFASKSCFVIKDPRISRTLPLWIEALRHSQREVSVVIPVRHPLEVAASLARREGFPAGKSVYLWLRCMLDSVRYSAGVDCGIVVYDELMQDWRSSIERLLHELNLTWPVRIDQAAPAIEQFLDKSLRHHQLAACKWQTEAEPANPVVEFAAQLYDALLRRAPDLAMLVNDIHQALVTLEAAYWPLVSDHERQRQASLKHYEEMQAALTLSYRNFAELERVLIAERQVYKNLYTEFNTKCAHILLLREEIARLEQQVKQLEAGDGPARS